MSCKHTRYRLDQQVDTLFVCQAAHAEHDGLVALRETRTKRTQVQRIQQIKALAVDAIRNHVQLVGRQVEVILKFGRHGLARRNDAPRLKC